MNKPLSLSELTPKEKTNFKRWCRYNKVKPTVANLYDYLVASGNDKRINEIQLP